MSKKKKKKRGPTPARGPATRRPATPPRQSRVQHRSRYLIIGLAALAIVGVLLVWRSATPDAPPVAGVPAPLRTEPPWQPQTAGLRERVEEAGFPPVGDESYHVHALLSVYVDGKQVLVPSNIGIDQKSGYHSPLHTHTPDGVIHFEADDPSAFTIQQVFLMWGVDLDKNRLGAYVPDGSKQIHVYVNGEVIADPATYEVQDGDNIVVAYGEKDSFPTEPPTDALRQPPTSGGG